MSSIANVFVNTWQLDDVFITNQATLLNVGNKKYFTQTTTNLEVTRPTIVLENDKYYFAWDIGSALNQTCDVYELPTLKLFDEYNFRRNPIQVGTYKKCIYDSVFCTTSSQVSYFEDKPRTLNIIGQLDVEWKYRACYFRMLDANINVGNSASSGTTSIPSEILPSSGYVGFAIIGIIILLALITIFCYTKNKFNQLQNQILDLQISLYAKSIPQHSFEKLHTSTENRNKNYLENFKSSQKMLDTETEAKLLTTASTDEYHSDNS